MDDEIDRKIDDTAIQFLFVQNRHQTHDLTLIGSGANGFGIQVCTPEAYKLYALPMDNRYSIQNIKHYQDFPNYLYH